jgi:hypothetical protein
LRTERDIRAVEHAADLHQEHRRRANRELGLASVAGLDTIDQIDHRLQASVHLPVAGNEFGPHE